MISSWHLPDQLCTAGPQLDLSRTLPSHTAFGWSMYLCIERMILSQTRKQLWPVHADVVGGWDDVEVGYLLGRGSSGSVYRAKCKDQHVAVKVLSQRPSLCISFLSQTCARYPVLQRVLLMWENTG